MEYNKIVSILYKNALKLNACNKFTGNESKDELIKLFFSIQGVEFCVKNNYPELSILRKFNGFFNDFNSFIDSGNIVIKNNEKAVLIGNVLADLIFDDKEFHHVILLHGAKANINISGWSVVKVDKADDCVVNIDKKEHGILI